MTICIAGPTAVVFFLFSIWLCYILLFKRISLSYCKQLCIRSIIYLIYEISTSVIRNQPRLREISHVTHLRQPWIFDHNHRDIKKNTVTKHQPWLKDVGHGYFWWPRLRRVGHEYLWHVPCVFFHTCNANILFVLVCVVHSKTLPTYTVFGKCVTYVKKVMVYVCMVVRRG